MKKCTALRILQKANSLAKDFKGEQLLNAAVIAGQAIIIVHAILGFLKEFGVVNLSFDEEEKFQTLEELTAFVIGEMTTKEIRECLEILILYHNDDICSTN